MGMGIKIKTDIKRIPVLDIYLDNLPTSVHPGMDIYISTLTVVQQAGLAIVHLEMLDPVLALYSLDCRCRWLGSVS